MGGLYTKFMDLVMPVLQENWQLAVLGSGALFLLGAVFRWKWVCDPSGENVDGFRAFVYSNFGEEGYRVITGISGFIIILCSVLLWVLM